MELNVAEFVLAEISSNKVHYQSTPVDVPPPPEVVDRHICWAKTTYELHTMEFAEEYIRHVKDYLTRLEMAVDQRKKEIEMCGKAEAMLRDEIHEGCLELTPLAAAAAASAPAALATGTPTCVTPVSVVTTEDLKRAGAPVEGQPGAKRIFNRPLIRR